LLDFHFQCIVEYDRRWLAFNVLQSFKKLGPDLTQYQAVIAHDEHQRRRDVALMTQALVLRGVINLDDGAGLLQRGGFFGAHLLAHLLLHEFIPIAAFGMFPHADVANNSNIEDFVSSGYNMETAYDMCGFARIANKGQHASADADQHGYVGQKSNFIRAILSQLRPAYLHESEAQTVTEAANCVVGGILCRAVLTELVHCRIEEYVVRAEPIWRQLGAMEQELPIPPLRSEADRASVPIRATHRPSVTEIWRRL
jgi:hypothetical protein